MTPEQWAEASHRMVADLTTDLRALRRISDHWDRDSLKAQQWAAVRGWLGAMAGPDYTDAQMAAATRAVLAAVDDPANNLMADGPPAP